MPTLLVPPVAYLHTQFGHCTDISFIGSTSLAVSRNPHIHQHPLAIESLAYPELTLPHVVLVQARGLLHTM